MVIHLNEIDWNDPDGPFGPIIRKWLAPEAEPANAPEEDDENADWDPAEPVIPCRFKIAA